jgi:chitinase
VGVVERFTAALVVLGMVLSGLIGVAAPASGAPGHVVAPYYAGWEQGDLRPSALPWSAMSHVIHFSLLPTASGGLDDATNGVTAARASELVAAAHARGKKVLISVGGTPGSEHWASAASPANRARFVANLVRLMDARGYDGIDLNWEGAVVEADYLAVIRDLRAALNARGRGELLTAVYFGSWTSLAAASHRYLDWVSMMTYLPYGQPGNSHNSPIYGSQYARIDNLVSRWLAAGVPAGKVLPGLATYASEWQDGRLVTPEMPYRTAVSRGYTTGLSWDATARATSWRSGTRFVSIEDERSVREKAAYVTSRGLRGLIVWELGAGRHGGSVPLMDAVRTHLPIGAPTTTTPGTEPETPPSTTPSGGFHDVFGGVHAPAIDRMAAAGVIAGYADGTFRPTRAITRGQLATLLTRALDLDARDCTGACTRLSDVGSSTHAAGIRALVGAGVASGFPDGTFRPGSPVTRAQLASMLAVGFELPPPTSRHPFTDVRGSVHEPAIAAAAAVGITTGRTATSFAPHDHVRRDQVASFMDRALAR